MKQNSITTLSLSRHKPYLVGIEAAAKGDMVTAADKLRGLIHHSPQVLPAVVTRLTQLAIQSDKAKQIHLLIAELFALCGWYTEAIQELQDVLAIDPKKTSAYQLLGKIWSRAPRYAEIETIFESAIDQDIYDSAILDILPKMYLGQFEYEKSVTLYQKLVSREPDSIHLKMTLATMYARCNRFSESIQTLDDVVAISPLHAGKIAGQLEDLVPQNQDNIQLRESLFRIYCKICKPDNAVQHLNAILDWHPTEAEKVTNLLKEANSLFPDCQEIYKALAAALIVTQEYSQSLNYLYELFRYPEKEYLADVKSMALQILTYFPAQVIAMQLLADISIYIKQFDEALDYVEKMVQYDLQEVEPVETRLTQITTLDPSLIDRCHYVRAKLYLYRREFDRAIVESQLCNGSDFHIAALQLSASAYERKNNYEKSEETLFGALSFDPYNTELHRQLSGLKQRITENVIANESSNGSHTLKCGTSYLMLGDYYLALEQLQKIEPSDPNYAASQLLVGRCFLDLGRYDQAINHLNRLISSEIPTQQMLCNQARLLTSTSYISLGDISRCISTLESILELDITFHGISDILNLLKQESLFAYRVKAVSACFNSNQQFIVSAVRNSEISNNQTVSFAHPHNNAGVDFLFKHQLKAAEDEFKLALQMDPNLTISYCNFAILKLINHQKDAALSLIKSAESISPHFELTHIVRGLIAMSENNLTEAERLFQAAYALRPDHFIVLLNLGDIYFQQTDYESAFRFWIDASKLAPIPHLIQRRMGYLIPISDYWKRWNSKLEIPISTPTL